MLTIDEILALQLFGYEPAQIINADDNTLSIFDSAEGEEMLDKAGDILDRQEDLGIITLAYDDVDFPELFLGIGRDCPPLIHLLGNTELLKEPAGVAIIGARAATPRGIEAAYRLGEHFAVQGRNIVSGLALGCDGAAHRGCLAADGNNIAIVATGLDITHPVEHIGLQRSILESGQGLLISEQPLGTKANGRRLVQRNRLQAALASEVIVAECPVRSGTMYTVSFARKYRRRVLAYDFGTFGPESGGNEMIITEMLGAPIKL